MLCLLLLVVWLFLYVYRDPTSAHREGFQQSQRFLVQRDADMYDGFSAHIYNRIYQPDKHNSAIFDAVESLTQMDHNKSILLDAGSGTGELLYYMASKGYVNAYGIDQSTDMCTYARDTYDQIVVKEGDLRLPMTYDKHSFTHIMMTGNTVYHFDDKVQLFRNIHYWLMPQGYFVLELYQRDRFDPLPATGKPLLVDSLQSLVKERVTDCDIDFGDFHYTSAYDFSHASSTNEVMFRETFVDSNTRNVRQNELVMYMEDVNEVVHLAQRAGFLVHGKMNVVDDPFKFVFVLQRMN